MWAGISVVKKITLSTIAKKVKSLGMKMEEDHSSQRNQLLQRPRSSQGRLYGCSRAKRGGRKWGLNNQELDHDCFCLGTRRSLQESDIEGEVTKDETWSVRPRDQQLAKITGMK